MEVVHVMLGLAGAVVATLICREIVCWYFKVNEIARDLHVIAEHYRGKNGISKPTS